MSCSQFKLTRFALLIIGLAFPTSPVLSQTVSSPLLVPCAKESTSDLPTLKIRQQGSRISSSPSIGNQQPSQKEECGHPDLIAKVLLNEPKVRFEGLHAFTVAEVLKLFRERRVSLPIGHILAPEVLAGAVTVLKESLEARGHVQASVEARQDEEANTMVFLVDEGPRFPIGEIRFEGNRVFPSQELAARMREFLSRDEETKNGYDAELFDYYLRQLSNLIRSRGYLQARFREPKRKLIDGGLVISVPVEEGPLYRLGEVTIEGAENVSQEHIRAILGLKRDDIADGEAIGKWLYEDLKKLYGEMGYIEYTAEPDPEFRTIDRAGHEGVMDLRVTIDEGRQFRVRSIKFDGTNLSEKEMRNLLLVKPGDVFNQQLFERCINQLNETKWFEMIDQDKDTDYRTDEEEGVLDITIRLKRVESP